MGEPECGMRMAIKKGMSNLNTPQDDLHKDAITGTSNDHPVSTVIGSVGGAITGGLLGASLGPAGAIAGSILGATAGGITGLGLSKGTEVDDSPTEFEEKSPPTSPDEKKDIC